MKTYVYEGICYIKLKKDACYKLNATSYSTEGPVAQSNVLIHGLLQISAMTAVMTNMILYVTATHALTTTHTVAGSHAGGRDEKGPPHALAHPECLAPSHCTCQRGPCSTSACGD